MKDILDELAISLRMYQEADYYEIKKPDNNAVFDLISKLNQLIEIKEAEVENLQSMSFIIDENFKGFGIPDNVYRLRSIVKNEIEMLEQLRSIVKGIE